VPSIIGFRQPTSARQADELAAINGAVSTLKARAPWQGYLPDLDVAHMGPSSARDIEGLIPRPDDGGLGEVLMHFPGFDHVDSTYDGSSASPPALGDAATTQEIVGLSFFDRVTAAGVVTGEYDQTTVAWTGGDDSTAGSAQMWRIVPTTGLWEEIVEEGGAAATSVALKGGYPDVASGEVTQLVDSAVFPASASPRTGLTAMTAGEPLLIFTNNFDNVKMYALPTGGGSSEDGTYEDLHQATLGNFKCRSVANWRSRMHFLNTVENGTRHRQRLRRSAVGNADPDTVNDGSGAIDFEDFQGEGLRVEGLGNSLACYFEDGVAFARATGQSVSPYVYQTITTERGLLSTHSLVNLGGGVHFGLFTDGWFFVSENGQFQEAGITQIDGTPTTKWRKSFFNRLTTDQRARISMVYDATNKWVHMSLPLDGTEDNQEVWVYDLQSDRVFTRRNPVTVFSKTNIQVSAAELIGDDDVPIGESEGSIGSTAARFSLRTILQGTSNGLVFNHDPDLSTEIDKDTSLATEPSFKYTTTLSGMGQARNKKAIREFFVEYIKAGGGNFTVKLFGNPTEASNTRTFSTSGGNIGDVRTLSLGYRFSATQISMELSGPAPFKMRSFEADLVDTGTQRRSSA
jgi:hypothetical protein